MTQEQRTFTLESWQWRKYKTRDGRDAKILYLHIDKKCFLTIMSNIDNPLIVQSAWHNSNGIACDDSHFDLFDVPDQKEPRKVFLVYTNEDDTDIKQFCLSLKEPAIKHKDTHWKNQMKVYIDDGRWDS